MNIDNGVNPHARLFMAIPLDDQSRQQIADWMENQKLQLPWRKPKNLHITILPPWEAYEQEIPDLVTRSMICAYHCQSFTMQLAERARIIEQDKAYTKHSVLWAGIQESQELLALRRYAFDQFFGRDTLPPVFQPHIMLARWEEWRYQPHDINLEDLPKIAIKAESLMLCKKQGRGKPTEIIGQHPMAVGICA